MVSEAGTPGELSESVPLFAKSGEFHKVGTDPLGSEPSHSFANGPKNALMAEYFSRRGRVCPFSQFTMVISACSLLHGFKRPKN